MSTGLFPLVCNSETGYELDVANLLIERLNWLISRDGRKARAISMAATGSPDSIRDILRGKTTSPRTDTLSRLAKELSADTRYLTGEIDTPTAGAGGHASNLVSAPVVRKVQAGAFMEVDLHVQAAPDRFISVVEDGDFPHLSPFACEVVGDSINRRCEEGGFAVCLDFPATGLEITGGMWVVVERHRDGLVESTIKRVKVERGHFELHPDSTNPTHKPIKFPSASPTEEVRVIALVRHFVGPTLTW